MAVTRCEPLLGWSRRTTHVGVALLVLLLSTPGLVSSKTAITNANAATAWVTDPTTAAATDGEIAGLNTTEVKSIVSLFNAKAQSNDDSSTCVRVFVSPGSVELCRLAINGSAISMRSLVLRYPYATALTAKGVAVLTAWHLRRLSTCLRHSPLCSRIINCRNG